MEYDILIAINGIMADHEQVSQGFDKAERRVSAVTLAALTVTDDESLFLESLFRLKAYLNAWEKRILDHYAQEDTVLAECLENNRLVHSGLRRVMDNHRTLALVLTDLQSEVQRIGASRDIWTSEHEVITKQLKIMQQLFERHTYDETRLFQVLKASISRNAAAAELLQTTVDTMMEGYQIIDTNWRYVYVNQAIARHGRRTKDELLGNIMMDVYPGIDGTEMFAVLQRCMNNRVSDQLENEFTFPDGSKGWFELRIEPVPEGILILSLDISQRKLAEESQKQVVAHLERANTDLEKCADIASHDLREQSRLIMDFGRSLQTYNGKKLDKTASQYVAGILEAAARIETLIDDALVKKQS